MVLVPLLGLTITMDVGNSQSGKTGQCSITTEWSEKSLRIKSSCIEFANVPRNSDCIPS